MPHRNQSNTFLNGNPLLGICVYFIFTVGLGSLTWSWWTFARHLPGIPSALPMSAAAGLVNEHGSAWVTLTDGVVDCDVARRYQGSRPSFPVMDDTQTLLFVYYPGGTDIDCPGVSARGITGVVDRFNFIQLSRLRSGGFPHTRDFTDENIFALCGHCNLDKAMNEVWVAFVLTILFGIAFLYHLIVAIRE